MKPYGRQTGQGSNAPQKQVGNDGMPQMFEPQQVPPDSWSDWMKEALALITARWVLNASLVVLPLLVLNLLSNVVVALLAPNYVGLLLGVFCRLAEATDKRSRFTLKAFRVALPGLTRLSVFVLALQGILLLLTGLGSYLAQSPGIPFATN